MSEASARIDDLLALAAAGAATDADVAELEVLLADTPSAGARGDAYRDVAAALPVALDPIAPSPSVRARVLGATRPRRRYRRAVALTAAVALAAAFALLWLRARSQLADVRAALEVSRATAAALHARYAPVRNSAVQLATVSNDAGATCTIFIDPTSGQWAVFAHDLPPLPADRAYQLWFVPADGAPLSAGLLSPQPDGSLGTQTTAPAGVSVVKTAVSVEPAGGSTSPTMSEIQLIGDLI